MSIAAYPLQSAIPSYADFELRGGQNNGSAFVLRGQANGAPTIMRPRVTPIQEASMSASISATVNTLFNNATANGWEGLAPTVELLKITDTGLQRLWHNGLFGQVRPDLWIADKRDWHQLTWITEIPQLGADLINVGLVNKCPSGYAKVSNFSLTNHYSRYYESLTEGVSSGISLFWLENYIPTVRVNGVPTEWFLETWYQSFLDTITVNIRAGEVVEQSASGIIGCITDSTPNNATLQLGIRIKYRSRSGQIVFKDVAKLETLNPIIEDQTFAGSTSWVADQDYETAEPILYVKKGFGAGDDMTVTASHRGIKVEFGHLTKSGVKPMSVRIIPAVDRYFVVSTGYTAEDFIDAGVASANGTIRSKTGWPAESTIAWFETEDQQRKHPAYAARLAIDTLAFGRTSVDVQSNLSIATMHAAKAAEAREVKFNGQTDLAKLPFIAEELLLRPGMSLNDMADEIWAEHTVNAPAEAARTAAKRALL